MADIIRFPTRRTENPAAGVGRSSPAELTEECCIRGHGSWKNNKLRQIQEEIGGLFGDSSLTDSTYYRFSVVGCEEDTDKTEGCSPSISELVVFSLEIQMQDLHPSGSAQLDSRRVLWGDVFLKIGDEYPFLFTLYTEEYVKHQLAFYGEKIKPSPQDIILKKNQLSEADLIRAVLKWVNLYSPGLRGRPVRLESRAILEQLVCDPGVEVVIAEPP